MIVIVSSVAPSMVTRVASMALTFDSDTETAPTLACWTNILITVAMISITVTKTSSYSLHSRLFRMAVLFSAFTLSMLVGASCLHAADASDLVDPKHLLESLPRDLVKDMGSKAAKGTDAIGEGSKKLAQLYDGKTATVSFKLTRIVQYQGHNNAFSEAERVRVAGTEFQINYAVYLLPSENEKAAKLKAGSKITASGKLQAQITRNGSQILWISVTEATLK